MKLDLNKQYKTLEGKVIPTSDTDTEPFTLKKTAITALLSASGDEISGQEKADRYLLAERIAHTEGEVDLKSEEVTLLKKLIGKVYHPLIVGQAFKFLEGE